MVIRIENSTIKEENKSFKPAQNLKDQANAAIPIVKEEANAVDNQEPIKGFYVETTGKNSVEEDDDDDGELVDNPDPNERITINPGIAIYKNTDEITNAMDRTVNKSIANMFQSSGETAFYKAKDMINDNQAYNCFDDINFTKRFNIYGKAVYELDNYRYKLDDLGSVSTRVQNSFKFDLGLNYKSKSEKTKAMLFSSFTGTKVKTNYETGPSETFELEDGEGAVSESANTIQFKSNYKSLSIYGAVQQQFKNKDFGILSAYHINDNTLDTKTTNIDASYFLNKYKVLAEVNTNIYKALDMKTITKTNFSLSLNPELTSQVNNENESSVSDSDPEVTQKISSKKWSKSFTPFFNSQSLNSQSVSGSTEEGLGGELRLKRTGQLSTLQLGGFGKISTTQQEDNNQYHLSFGALMKYSKNWNKKSQLKAKLSLKDRVTFGQGNIMTANATVSYVSPKVTAELEGKYINVNHADFTNYGGVVGRVFYTPNKNVNVFLEGCYTNMKEPNAKSSNSVVQAGVIANF